MCCNAHWVWSIHASVLCSFEMSSQFRAGSLRLVDPRSFSVPRFWLWCVSQVLRNVRSDCSIYASSVLCAHRSLWENESCVTCAVLTCFLSCHTVDEDWIIPMLFVLNSFFMHRPPIHREMLELRWFYDRLVHLFDSFVFDDDWYHPHIYVSQYVRVYPSIWRVLSRVEVFPVDDHHRWNMFSHSMILTKKWRAGRHDSTCDPDDREHAPSCLGSTKSRSMRSKYS